MWYYSKLMRILRNYTKILEKLFRENKTSPLLKTPEKDFQERQTDRQILLHHIRRGG